MALLPVLGIQAQLNYSENFESGAAGWTGMGTTSGPTMCNGSGVSARVNLYSGNTSVTFTSPEISPAMGGDVRLRFNYKVADWSGNTSGTPNPWGSLVAQWTNDVASGPWHTIGTVDASNHTVSGTCAFKEFMFTPTTGAIHIRFVATWSSGDYYLNLDDISLFEFGAACSGPPPSLNVVSSVTQACVDAPINLGLSSVLTESGLTYRWQRADDAAFTTNVVNLGVSNSQTTTQSSASWYRCLIICSDDTTATSALSVTMRPPMDCYCPAGSIGFDVEPISQVQFANVDNSSPCTIGGTPAYQDFTSIVANLNAGQTYTTTLSGNTGGNFTNYFTAFFDFDRNGTFETAFPLGSIVNTACAASATGSFTVPILAAGGTSRMRIIKNYAASPLNACGNYDYGQIEDYTIDVTPAPICSAPTAGITVVPAGLMVCAGANFNLGVSIPSTTLGMVHTWQSADDEDFTLNVTTLGTGANPSFSQTTAKWYRVVTTCDYSADPALTSPAAYVGLTPAHTCTACVALHTAATACITKVSFGEINHVSPASCALPSYGMYAAAGSGTFYPGFSYSIEINTADLAIVSVWIDSDHSGTYDSDEWTQVYTEGIAGSANILIPGDALMGITGMRVRSRGAANPNGPGNACTSFGGGETEDFLINIQPPPPCSPVNNITAVALDEESATLTWSCPDCPGPYVVEYGMASTFTVPGTGATAGTGGTLVLTSDTTITIAGLSYPHQYRAFIRQDCTADELGHGPNMSAPLFRTLAPHNVCATPLPLTVQPVGVCVPFATASIGGTMEGVGTASCYTASIQLPTVYYSFVATGYGQVIETDVNGMIHAITVRDSCSGAEIGCEFFGAGVEGSALVVGLTPGNTYIIRVQTLAETEFTICVSESAVEQPANDNCAEPTVLSVQPFGICEPLEDDNSLATASGPNGACVNPVVTIADLWYSFTATHSNHFLQMEHASPDGFAVELHQVCDSTELLCTFSEISGSIPFTNLTPGNDYLVRVGSMAYAAGPFGICITSPYPMVQELSCDDTFVDAGGSSANYPNSANEIHTICPDEAGDVVVLTFSTFNIESGYDGMFVYDGNTIDPSTLIPGSGVINSYNPYYALYGNNGAGAWYGTTAPNNFGANTLRAFGPTGCLTVAFISDDSFNNPGWSASVACITPNYTCANAQEVGCNELVSGFTTGVAHNLPEGGCPFNGAASTGGQNWFVYTAEEDSQLSLSTCLGEMDFDTRISVYTGSDCSNLSCVALADDYQGCDGGSSLDLPVTAGTTYYIAVHGAGAEEGNFQLLITCSPLCPAIPANDGCGGAMELTVQTHDGSQVPVLEDNACASSDGPTACSGANPVIGLWYSFNTGDNSTILLDLDGLEATGSGYTASNLQYALYTGDCTQLGATDEVDCGTNSATGPAVLNLLPNTNYKVLVYSNASSELGSYAITATSPLPVDLVLTSVDQPSAGLLCGTSVAPVINVTNNGGNTVNSITVTYGSGTTHSYQWNGSLAYGASTLINLPAITVPYGPQTLNVSVAVTDEEDGAPADNTAAVSIDAGGQSLVVSIRTDASPEQLFWVVMDANLNVLAMGGEYTEPHAEEVTTVCLPADPGGSCYQFYIFDGFGDGLCCTNGNGYWELRNVSGGVLLRDNFDGLVDGSTTPASAQSIGSYGFAHGICLPAGPAAIASADCGVYSNNLQSRVDCTPIAGASRYQFEFSDPDAGFRRWIAVPRPWVRFDELVTVPLTAGVTYFARVRVDQGVLNNFNDDHFGIGCEMGIDPNQVMGCTGLIDNISLPTHSCGVVKPFGGSAKVVAQPVSGATQYRFRFTNAGEGFVRTMVKTTYVCQLNWQTLPLVNGHTYQVDVETFIAGEWKGYCGPVCPVTIINSGFVASQTDGVSGTTATLESVPTLWPNPTADGEVNLLISNVPAGVQRIQVDVFDLQGQRVMAREYASNNSEFRTLLDLPVDIASGMYMVRVNMNEETHNLKLSVR